MSKIVLIEGAVMIKKIRLTMPLNEALSLSEVFKFRFILARPVNISRLPISVSVLSMKPVFLVTTDFLLNLSCYTIT